MVLLSGWWGEVRWGEVGEWSCGLEDEMGDG